MTMGNKGKGCRLGNFVKVFSLWPVDVDLMTIKCLWKINTLSRKTYFQFLKLKRSFERLGHRRHRIMKHYECNCLFSPSNFISGIALKICWSPHTTSKKNLNIHFVTNKHESISIKLRAPFKRQLCISSIEVGEYLFFDAITPTHHCCQPSKCDAWRRRTTTQHSAIENSLWKFARVVLICSEKR